MDPHRGIDLYVRYQLLVLPFSHILLRYEVHPYQMHYYKVGTEYEVILRRHDSRLLERSSLNVIIT
jgi:hypothetical protein